MSSEARNSASSSRQTTAPMALQHPMNPETGWGQSSQELCVLDTAMAAIQGDYASSRRPPLQEKYGRECSRHHCPGGDLNSKVGSRNGIRAEVLSPRAEYLYYLMLGTGVVLSRHHKHLWFPAQNTKRSSWSHLPVIAPGLSRHSLSLTLCTR